MNYDALKACRLFLLDMDGTLYLGDEVIHGAIDFIHTLEQTGRRYIYLTNNSSRAGTDYVNRLRKLGFPCEMENVFTSGMATGMYLAEEHKGVPVYPVGTPAFLDELRSYGVPLTEGEDAGVVCVGDVYKSQLHRHRVLRRRHAQLLRRGQAHRDLGRAARLRPCAQEQRGDRRGQPGQCLLQGA